ncbi:hypothetical protein I5K77_18935, partial [Pseudomonas aeruginosa]|nr:hypothetical protein [Pseudomonas aeruginosa]
MYSGWNGGGARRGGPPPALPPAGGRFDLAIALGILAASGQLPGTALDGLECLGEL